MSALIPNAQEAQRRRGAPLGNSNARKHGAYAHNRPTGRIDPKDLAELGLLTKEIMQLRAFFQVIYKSTPKELGYSESLYTVRALSQAAFAIARMYDTTFELIHLYAEARAEVRDQARADGSRAEGRVQERASDAPHSAGPQVPPPWADPRPATPAAISKEMQDRLNKLSKTARMPPAARDQFIRRISAINNAVKDVLPSFAMDGMDIDDKGQHVSDLPLDQ